MGDVFRIIWTDQAVESLRDIYDYFKDKSPQGAANVLHDLLNSPKAIVFAQQFQIDDINPKYRRIVVRNYKVLYREDGKTIYIIDIVSTHQSPEVLQRR